MILPHAARRFPSILAGVAMVILAVSSVHAGPSTEPVQASGYLAQLIGGLALVILLIFVLSWLLRRLPGGTGQGVQVIEVLAVKPLGMRERLMLVRVGEEQILLAMTPAGIRHIHTLSQPIDPQQSSPAHVDFATLLRRFGGQGSDR